MIRIPNSPPSDPGASAQQPDQRESEPQQPENPTLANPDQQTQLSLPAQQNDDAEILFDGVLSESQKQYGDDILAAVGVIAIKSLICHGALVGQADGSRSDSILGRGVLAMYAWTAIEVLSASKQHENKLTVHYLLRTARPSNNVLDLDDREWPIDTAGIGVIFVSNASIINEIVRVTDAIIDMYNIQVTPRVRAMLDVVLSIALIPGDDTFTKTDFAFVVFNVSKIFDMIEGDDIARFVEACAVGVTKLNDRRLSTALYVAMRMGTRQGADLFDDSKQPHLVPFLTADRALADPEAKEAREQIYLAFMAQKLEEDGDEELGLWQAALSDSVEVWGSLVPRGHGLCGEVAAPEPIPPEAVLHRALCAEKIQGASNVKRPTRMDNNWKLLPSDVEPLDTRGMEGRFKVTIGGSRKAALVFDVNGNVRLTFKDARNYLLNVLQLIRINHIVQTQLREEMIDVNTVYNRAVVYMMMHGELDTKGTRAVLQHILYGGLKISNRSKNSLMRAIGCREGWEMDGSISPRIFQAVPIGEGREDDNNVYMLFADKKFKLTRHGARWRCRKNPESDSVCLSRYGLLETGASIGEAR